MKAAKKDDTHKPITNMIAIMRDKHDIPIDFTDVHMVKGAFDFNLTFGGHLLSWANKEGNFTVACVGLSVQVEAKTGRKGLTDAEWSKLKRNTGAYMLVRNFRDVIKGMRNIIGATFNEKLCKRYMKQIDIMEEIYTTLYADEDEKRYK